MHIFCLSFLSKRHQPEARIVWALQETACFIREHLETTSYILLPMCIDEGLEKKQDLRVLIIDVQIIETF